MQERFQIGNAQTIGDNEFQSGYFSVFPAGELCRGRKLAAQDYVLPFEEEAVIAVLADGGIDHINGRRAAVIAVHTSLETLLEKPVEEPIEECFDRIAFTVIKELKEQIYLGKKPYLSFSAVYRTDEYLSYYNVGANSLFVFDGKDLILLRERNAMISLHPDRLFGMMSREIYVALSEIELLELLSLPLTPYEKAIHIVEAVNEKKLKAAGNATIILITGER